MPPVAAHQSEVSNPQTNPKETEEGKTANCIDKSLEEETYFFEKQYIGFPIFFEYGVKQ